MTVGRDALSPDALITRAKREEDTYGQKELPAMLRAGAEAMREVERLRAALDRSKRLRDHYRKALDDERNHSNPARKEETAK